MSKDVNIRYSDSDLAVQVKAFSLKAINDIEQAMIHYEELFKRKPNPFIAYELAEMKICLLYTSDAADEG